MRCPSQATWRPPCSPQQAERFRPAHPGSAGAAILHFTGHKARLDAEHKAVRTVWAREGDEHSSHIWRELWWLAGVRTAAAVTPSGRVKCVKWDAPAAIVARHAIAVACPPLNNGACPHLPTCPAKGHVVRIVYDCQTVQNKMYFLPKMSRISLYTLAKKEK